MTDNNFKRLSILRWSGSKAKLVPDLRRLRPKKFNRYVEPFVGSACLFFDVAPERSILGDINPSVIDVYKAISADSDRVADALASIPHTADAFYALRAVEPSSLDLTYRAARLIFLMKACFNGVYRTNKKGEFNVPMGSRVYALPSREDLSRAANMLKGATLFAGDFRDTTSHCEEGDWVYMDPPYRQAGRYRGEYGYSAEFDEQAFGEFTSLAANLASRGVNVMVSYQYDTRLVQALPGWSVHAVSPRRTVAGKATSRLPAPELIMTSYSS
ncbi:DNA adenine methylase [Burkholderia sp. KJ006]|uniref:DNA adenine methylase n=1 Tax=Burkholderia sp. KJ006 TaxID=416344 RepID=UPI00130ECA58|nr:Dam family site-specific DNA-(adenine-N6)-methyltransferase [Burkholderia sp. KJ006]